MKTLLIIFVLFFGSVFAEDIIVEDKELLQDVQKMLMDNGFEVNAILPKVVYYKSRPPHFAFFWAGLTKFENGTIEILIMRNKSFDLDTFYHECYHWFIIDVDRNEKTVNGIENRAERFAKLCVKHFKNKVPKGLIENSK